MRLCSIASGSSGNCIYVGSDSTHILIDAGISGKRIEQGLNQLDLTGRDLSAILVTHEHSDHIQGLGVMARRYGVPIYTTGGTVDAMIRSNSLGKKIPDGIFHEIREDEVFRINDLSIEAFSIPHDAAQPVGYRVENGGKAVGIATDLGKYNEYIVEHLTGLHALLLEANHDVNMLQVGRYPYNLKRRILGDRGHLSNENAGRLLCRLLHEDLSHILLGHLSQENNYEKLAYETVCSEVTMGDNPYQASDFHIEVAHRDCPSELVQL
ncbi:MAG: MBL fold metallo-hydrolase [Eubacteriales bacterium]|nr:MBL fold metallo-hydrolase [Eubacteriales bacterium]